MNRIAFKSAALGLLLSLISFSCTKFTAKNVGDPISNSNSLGVQAGAGSSGANAPAACNLNGVSILSGQSVVAYQASMVSYGQTCMSQSRTCTNGNLSGSYGFSSCSVAPANSCLFNGNSVASGASVTSYLATNVPYGQTCTSQTRTCTNGTLSGTYTNASCTVQAASSCSFNSAEVKSGSSVTAYQASSVAYGQSCVSQTRTCSNGTLSGTYTYPTCAVQSAPNSCTFNSTVVTSGTSVTAFQAATVPAGQTCVSQTRTCTNGTLSGSYTFSTCAVLSEAMLSIQFDQSQFNPTTAAGTMKTYTAGNVLSVGKASLSDIDFTKINFRFSNPSSTVMKIAKIEFQGDLTIVTETGFTGAIDIPAQGSADLKLTPKPKYLGAKQGIIHITMSSGKTYDISLKMTGL